MVEHKTNYFQGHVQEGIAQGFKTFAHQDMSMLHWKNSSIIFQ